MPFVTEHFLLEAFLDGDSYSALADKRRFSTIDNQFNSMTSIIGDGRISGWEIKLITFPNVLVTKGAGFIDQFYVTTFDDQAFALSPNSTSYFYAQRRVGTTSVLGPLSNVANLTYIDAAAPAAPVGFVSSLPTSTVDPFFNVELSWNTNTEVDLDHYEIERTITPPTGYSLVATIDSTLTIYVDPVNEDSTYAYRLYAVDQSGFRSIPATVNYTTLLSPNLPPNPMEVTTPPSEGAINILWKRPVSLDVSNILRWEITFVRLNSDSTEIPVTSQTVAVDKNNMFYRLDNLLNGELYKVTIQTIDNKGRASSGVTKTISPILLLSPKDPEGISVLETELVPGDVVVTLAWGDGADEYDPSIPDRYNIYVTVDGQQESDPIFVPIGETEQQIELYGINESLFAIPQDTLVTFRLTSISQNGQESKGNYLRFFTADFGQPLPISNLQSIFNTDQGEVIVTWDNQPDTSYIVIKILDDDLGSDYPVTEIINKNIGLVEFFKFSGGLNHSYAITVTPFNVNNVAGPSDVTVEVTLIAGGFSPPALPRDLSPQSGDRQVMFSWLSSPDFSVVSYNIYKKTGNITTVASDWFLLDTVPKTINLFNDYGLENNTIYSYYVTAIDLYGQESLHLPDGAVNLNFIEIIPKPSGIIVEPDNVQVSLAGGNILVTWDSLSEEFDSFEIRRSIGNLHLWETIATVDRNTLSYLDSKLPLINGTTFYYTVGKTLNDTDIVVQISNIAPENSIPIGTLILNATTFGDLDITPRRDLLNLGDPIGEFTTSHLLTHKHKELDKFDPERIDLRPELVVTDWESVDGRIFTTKVLDINGTGFVVKVNGRFPGEFFEIDTLTRRLIFAEPIVSVDSAGNITEALPVIEMRVLGVEEVQNIMPANRFDNIHARQVAFGRLNKEQIPSINHEGRIRETLLPKTFNLERFSNHVFIVPQGNADATKNFGDGTTFFSVIEGDGLIDEVMDWDQENDGAVVGFRLPSFATDTLLNLKQNTVTSFTSLTSDEAIELNLKDNQIFGISIGIDAGQKNLFTVDSTAPANVNNIGNTTVYSEDMTFDSVRNRLLICTASSDRNTQIYAPELITGNIFEKDETYALKRRGFMGLVPDDPDSPGSFGVSSMEFNHNDGNLYIIHTGAQKLAKIDLDNLGAENQAALTVIGSSSLVPGKFIFAMAMDTTNNIMYGSTSFSSPSLYTINLTTGVATIVSGSSLSRNFTSMTYDKKSDKLYGLDGFVGNDAELFEIDRSAGTDISLGVFTPPTKNCQAIAAPPPDKSFWLVDDFLDDTSLTLTNSPGVLSDVYLRFQVNVDRESKLSSANIVLTALDSDYSVGNIDLRISILDPGAIVDSLDFSTESIKNVTTIDSITLSPPGWAQGDAVTINVTTLVQTFVDTVGFFKNRHIIFKIETLSSSEADSLRAFYSIKDPSKSPMLNVSFVVDSAEVTSDEFFQSEKSYAFAFEFEDSDPTRWIRVTTFNTPLKPNPVIDLKKRLKFKILTKDIDIYVALGVREITNETAATGSNGGISGPVEWVGVSEIITNELDSTAPKGKLINSSPNWQEVEFDLEKEIVHPFSIDSNGILEGKLGVLEHLAFTIVPEQTNPTGPVYVYIDKLEQVDDVLVSGTSQGILLSRDFGTSWNSVRFVETPVHKFYRAINNPFIWAVGTNTVLLATEDLENWFETSGLTGVQYVRDIAEDDFGNMYVSTDKGVYWFEIGLINNFSSWRQTQPVNAFTTDCYGMYHNSVTSGVDEIWVSTEIGIFKTLDQGQTWRDTNMSTQGLPAFQFANISNTDMNNIVCITRKHVLRKLGTEADFTVLANFEVQHNIFDIWVFEYFSGKLYISTGKGVYSNVIDELFAPKINTIFVRVLPGLDINGRVKVAFGLDAIQIDNNTNQLFIGQENRIMMADEENALSIKEQFPNKELPLFFKENTELSIGYVYNAFNNVLVFRSPQKVNKVYKASYIPRKIFIPIQEGWAQTNPEADVFIYVNGLPKWIDFKLDKPQILSELQVLQGKLSPIVGTLNDFNSLGSEASAKLNEVIAYIDNMIRGGTDSSPLINNATIIAFMEVYTRFLSLVTNSIVLANALDVFPKINIAGLPASLREDNSRAGTLEIQEDFTASDSTGINIDTVTGEVDFLSIFTNTTDIGAKLEYVFNKYDKMQITVFNANVSNIGKFTHHSLEDKMEAVNTGLSSQLTRTHYANLIKTGIFMESNHHFLFDRLKISNIQSKFYAAYTSNWYDILNSTLDYNSILTVDNSPESHFANTIQIFTENPYLLDRVWIGTDSDILQYVLDTSTGKLTLEKPVRPGSGFVELFIWHIFTSDEQDIYVVAEEKTSQIGHIFRTVDAGLTWTELETINLPQKIYKFSILSGNKVTGTENGIFFSDNNFGTWFPANLTLSTQLSDNSPSVATFTQRIQNIETTTFMIAESDRWFYTSGSGLDWFALGGQTTTNNISVINKVARFKSLTWIATDKGLYTDGNSVLADSIQFGLQTGLEDSASSSAKINVSDIDFGVNAFYCSAGNKIYRFLDNEWLNYTVGDVTAIHKIVLRETPSEHWLIVASHNIVRTVNVTPSTGVFG